MGLFNKIKDFLRGKKGIGKDETNTNTNQDIQTTFNEDGLDVLVEDGTVENATEADTKVEMPEGIGADGFTMRTWKPYDNKNYITTSWGGWNTCIQGYPTDSQANVLSNCVGYASGRFNEIINIARDSSGCAYTNLNCNAENFVERAQAAGLSIGMTPRRGAIMCWQKGSLSSGDGAGHVAIVEAVYSNSSVYTSESAYGGTAFYNSSRNNSNGRWGMGSAYSFRCFIYLPDDVQRKIDGSPAPTPGPSGKFNIGDRVIINGPLYTSSNASSAAGSTGDRETNITRKIEGAAHPYNTTGDLGWMDESSIRAASPAPAPTPSGWPKSYTVVSGDTLSEIAERFYGNGDAAHYNFIAQANGISNPSLIYPGQVLTIPEYNGGGSSSGFNVGDRVEIIGNYASSAYNKSAPNNKMKGSIRYITAIFSDGNYPYQLGANPGDTSSQNTTGFAKASGIRKV